MKHLIKWRRFLSRPRIRTLAILKLKFNVKAEVPFPIIQLEAEGRELGRKN